jgi:hypothetical protein
MDDFQKLSADAAEVKISDFHDRLFREFLQHDITAEDIAEMLNNEEQRVFWEDFRLRYLQAGEDSETMLRTLTDEEKDKHREAESTRARDARNELIQRRGDYLGAPPLSQPEKKSLPEPEVSRNRRGGSRPSKPQSPIIRALGKIRRILFGGN